NGHFEDDTMTTAIFGDVSDAMFDGIARGADSDTFSIHTDFAGVCGSDAKENAGKFGAASADETREAENFAGAEFEGHVRDVGGTAAEVSNGQWDTRINICADRNVVVTWRING